MEEDDGGVTTIDKTKEPEKKSYREALAERLRSIPSSQGHKIPFGRLKEISFARTEYFADIPAGTDPNVLLESGYWIHYSRVLRPLDKIEALCEDGTWEGTYRVMFVGEAEVLLSPINFVEHGTQETVESDTHFIKWFGPIRKFGVVRKDDGSVVKDLLYPKSEAAKFLAKHLAKLKI